MLDHAVSPTAPEERELRKRIPPLPKPNKWIKDGGNKGREKQKEGKIKRGTWGDPPQLLTCSNRTTMSPTRFRVPLLVGALPSFSCNADHLATLASSRHLSWTPAGALPKHAWQRGRSHAAASSSSLVWKAPLSRSGALSAFCLWKQSGTAPSTIRWRLLRWVAMYPTTVGSGGFI